MSRIAAAAAAVLVAALPLEAQRPHSAAAGVQYQAFSFEEGFPVENVSLLLFPVAYQLPVGDAISIDVYGGIGTGRVAQETAEHELTGLVDTRVRASWRASPWAVVTLGVDLPTGESTHDPEEAIVAGALTTNLLGFRESNFGMGFGVSSGIATAYRAGEWGIGFGASYRYAGEFEPRTDTTFTYQPGNEAKARIALDRSFGRSSKLTAGVTFQNFATDEVDGRDLFASGDRLRGDLSFAFRTGRSATWTLYATDIWREQGDLTLQILDPGGTVVGDSTLSVGEQNLVIAGLGGAISMSPSLGLMPALDFRFQDRADGGDGWLLGGGLDASYRWNRGVQLVPRARLMFGAIDTDAGVEKGIWGGELGLTVRWTGGS